MSSKIAKDCCEDMRRQLTLRCGDHEDLSDCPDYARGCGLDTLQVVASVTYK